MIEPELPPDDLSPQARALLEGRAERLRRAPAAATPDEEVAWIASFPIGAERWALPLVSVRAVTTIRHVTPVPLAPRHVLGVFRFEGHILSAHSTVALLGSATWEADPRFLLVVETSARRLFALDSEHVPMASTLPARAIREARPRPDGVAREVWAPTREVVRLIDVDALSGSR